MTPAGALSGVPVFEQPTLIGTREIRQAPGAVYVHSFGCLLQMLVARARWHDERAGCPTWTGAPSTELGGRCCCDVELPGPNNDR